MTLETESIIIRKLEEWSLHQASFPKYLDLYRKLLNIQSDARSHINLPDLQLIISRIDGKIADGRPVIEYEDIPFDWDLIENTFNKISSVFDEYTDLLHGLPEEYEGLSIKTIIERWHEGSLVNISPESYRKLGRIIQACLKPYLTELGQVLIQHIDQEKWFRPYCPICGSSPDFSVLEKERGSRLLLCSQCDTEWLYNRVGCPFCGNQDQKSIAFFTDDSGLYRLYVCEKCKAYLKTIDARCADETVFPTLERIITLDMDIQASRKGYRNYFGTGEYSLLTYS